ncbi:MAG TPA: PQQ-binding-like beta-propeller repeat protein [Steroidobacteraceae bacterium]|jgi:outer membrane protein assembly factor BamB
MLILAMMLATLSACGGGGESTGNTGASPLLSPYPSSISVTAALDQNAPTAEVTVMAESLSTLPFYVSDSTTHNGVDLVSAIASGGEASFNIVFKSPAALGIGTYTDTLTLESCVDQACTEPMATSLVSVTYVVTKAAPQIVSLTPYTVTAGAAAFTLTVSGSYFQSSSQVLWNGSALSTTYVSASQLTAQVSAADVAAVGTTNVQVATGSAQSDPDPFYITQLVPVALNQVSPSSVTAGGVAFYVTAIGTGFNSYSVIDWNGAALATTYVSPTVLRALVPANLIANTGSASVTVVNPTVQNAQTVTIAAPSLDATAYQMNPAHTGAVSFQNLVLPSASTWSVDLGGSASYALIVGGRVFVTAAANGGGSQLFALSATSGATLWGPIALAGQVNVTYDVGRLFVVVYGTATTQVLSALDPTTGNSLWTITLPNIGPTFPPVAANGIVYTTNTSGAVTAFDETSGAQLWTADIAGGYGIVAVTADGVYGSYPCAADDVQPLLGSALWNDYATCAAGGTATPVVADGVVYSPIAPFLSSGMMFDAESGTAEGTYTASVIPAISSTAGFFLSNGTLQGVASSNNQVLWTFTGDGQLSSAPIVVNTYVFVGSASGNLYALDATTGAQVWSENLGAPIPANFEDRGTIYTGLAAGDGLLVVPNGTKVTAFTLSSSP